jgi:cytochrome oxidase assembly protein ShyY1
MVTWWQMARRPQWLGVLAFVLALAGIFVLLSQWQIARAVEQATVIVVDSENPVPLTDVAAPQQPISAEAGGRRVTVSGAWADDFVVVEDRKQISEPGSWVVRNFVTDDGACLPVAVGWGTAAVAADFTASGAGEAVTIRGRIVPTEAASEGDYMHGRITVVATPDLINRWQCDRMYGGFLAMEDAPAPLASIETLPPKFDSSLNWLNIFYAAEWVFFAGFALYFWYRIVLDAVERENDPDDAGGSDEPRADN